jgi:hypothetical protein
VTATAATAGDRCQPSTSSSTSRNSAAVSAADNNASARLASTCGRSGDVSPSAGRRTTRPRSAIAAGSAMSRKGICTTKIDRHENADVNSPPSTGPNAAPATPADAHHRAPTLSAPDASTSNSRLPTITNAPPTACAARAAIRTPKDGATAHAAVAAAKTTRPATVATAGSPRTHTRAAGTATSASTRLNAVRTHATCATSAPKSPKISGRASVTTPESPSTTATTSHSATTTLVFADPTSCDSPLRSAPIERTLPHHADPRRAGPRAKTIRGLSPVRSGTPSATEGS